MMDRVRRHGFAGTFLLAVLIATTPAHAWCILGFGQCAPSIVGEYVLDGDPIARLTITADKFTAAIGPESFTTDYVIKSVDGNHVSIEIDLSPTAKMPLEVRVEKDHIRFDSIHVLVGVWKRQAAGP
jgi:hypothetical protein